MIYKNEYAVSSEELVEGMTSIAVPVFDFSESVANRRRRRGDWAEV